MILKVNPEEFKLWSNLIYEYTGIVIPPAKTYLIENRLSEMAADMESKTFSELYYKVRYTKDPSVKERLINLVTTQETSFFRDKNVYEAFRRLVLEHVVPQKRQEAGSGTPRLRIWSAACSTGQEPYTIAMTLAETVADIDNWDLTIIGTDIADNAFRKASLGRYSDLEVGRGLDQGRLNRFFEMKSGLWQVKDHIRAMVFFQKINLLTDSFRSLGRFDIIFCRNVSIYFNQQTKRLLFTKISEVMTPTGHLFVGATESASQILPIYKPVHNYNTVYYELKGPGG